MYDTTSPLFGVRLVPAPNLVETVRIERRVPGGYLQRWLIREIVDVQRPLPEAIHDVRAGVIYMHPDLIARLNRRVRQAL